ncbi:hypothetical protein HK101_009310 [Irineochytrium annulatum]|nr:hypothetical protein HK101_009310 [Irineochytrium annulatum]
MLASEPTADLLLDRTSTEATKIPPRSIPSRDAAGNLLDDATISPAPRLSHATSRKHRISKRGPVGPRKILVALDITDESEDALLWCLDHVVRDGDTLCLSTLQVENASWTDYFKLLVGGTKRGEGRNLELEERARVRAQELLEKGSRMVEEHSAEMQEIYKVQTAVLATTEAIEPQLFILSLLASEKPDLVVVGSREPQLSWAPASEGVVECMARYAPCPVLVHRTPERTPEAHVFDAGVKSAAMNAEAADALDGLLAGIKAPVTDALKERGALDALDTLDAQTPEESLKVKEKNALREITGGGMGLTPHERETAEHVKEKSASLYSSAADTLKGTAGAITHKASEYYNSAGQVIHDKSASLYTSAAETIKAIPSVISHTASDIYTATAGTMNRTSEIVSNKSAEAYNATADTLQATGETLQSTGETVANKSSEYASAAAGTIKDTASSTYNAAADTSARAYDAAADVTTRAYNQAGDLVNATAETLQQTGETVANKSSEYASAAAGTIKDTASSTYNVAADTSLRAYDAVADTTTRAYNTTADTLQATGETVSRKAGEYYEAGMNKAGELVNATAETLQQTGEAVAAKSSELANAAAETGTHYYNRAAETATETGKNIKNTTMEYANAAAEKSGQMYEQAKQTGSEYASAAADKSSELYDSAKRTATVYGQQAAENYSEMYDSAKRAATEYGNTAAEKSSQLYDTAKRTATEVGKVAAETSNQLIDSAKKTGSQVSDKTSDLYSQAKRTGVEMYDQATDKVAQAKDSTKDAFHAIKKSESAEPAQADASWKDTHSGAPLGDRAWDLGTAPAGNVGGAGFHWRKGEEPAELGQASVKAEKFEGITGSEILKTAKKGKSEDDEEALQLKKAMGMPLPGAKGREERSLDDLAEVFTK